MLGYVEDGHDNVPGVGDDEYRAEGLEDPLEEDPGLEVVQIVLVDDELDQLHAHHEGEEDARNGDDDCLREGADHVKDAAVPGLGRLSHLGGYA